MPIYVLKNEAGEYCSPRSGNCSPDFDPFSHLFRSMKSIEWNRYCYSNHNLHIEEVEVVVVSNKKVK